MKRFPLVLLAAATLLAGCPKAPPETGGIPAELVEHDLDTRPIELPPMREQTLENGLTLLVVEDHELPVATIALYWPAGDVSDPPGLEGVTSFAGALLTQGTATRDAQEIAGAFERVGGHLTSASDLEWSYVQARVLSRDLDMALDVVADIAQNPSYPGEELEETRRIYVGQAKQRLDSPEELASSFATARVFGAANPYSFELREEPLRKISRADVVAQQKKLYGPSGAILAVGGDVDGAKLLRELATRFGGWNGAPAPRPAFPPMPAAKRSVLLVHKPELTQTFLRVGLPGIRRGDPRYPASLLANGILGGSYSSRLVKVVRAEGGKTYGVSSWLGARREQGAFWVETSTRTQETVATLDLVLTQVARMRDHGVSANELANAKSNRVGSYARNFETGSDVLGAIITARMMGLPASTVTDWRKTIADTSLDDVNRAAKELLDVDRAVIVVVGDADKVRGDLEKAFGPVEVVDFRADPREVRAP